MNPRRLAVLFVALVLTASVVRAQGTGEQHHYTITARVRPLVVFWITRAGVGDAFVSKRVAPDEAEYSLLIGSDPDRTPFHINRWGYINEIIRGASSQLIGVMTESDEESIDEAEAHVRNAAAARHAFKAIEASADGRESHARVRSIEAPQDYTLRHLPAVLDLMQRDASEGRSRVLQVPAGAHPGFLSALAEAMRDGAPKSIRYVYFGRLYELRRTRTASVADVRIGRRSYGSAVAADFVTTSLYDGERTTFSLTYGTTGRFAGVPFRAVYQPRWWMQIELAIDDSALPAAQAEGDLR
jgi:hypothetical protein